MQKITNFVLAEINFAMHHVIAIIPDTEFARTATINLWSEQTIEGTKIFGEKLKSKPPFLELCWRVKRFYSIQIFR